MSLSYSSCYSLGFFLSPFLSKLLLTKFGRLRSAFLMIMLQSVCILSFGLSKAFPNNALFLLFSMLSRLSEGLVVSLFSSSLMMMAPAYFESYSSYLTAINLGLDLADLLGPLWGGLLFSLLGYIGIFAAQSLLSFLTSFMVLYFRSHEKSNPYRSVDSGNSLSYCALIKVPVRMNKLGGLLWASGLVGLDLLLYFGRSYLTVQALQIIWVRRARDWTLLLSFHFHGCRRYSVPVLDSPQYQQGSLHPGRSCDSHSRSISDRPFKTVWPPKRNQDNDSGNARGGGWEILGPELSSGVRDD